ncbi:SRPBCC family protein [Actinokineospora soli]
MIFTMTAIAEPTARGQVTIDAPAEEVWAYISDPVRMADFASELESCRWLDGVSSATVGARFAGANRNGWRRWTTTCTVLECEPGHRFAYSVHTPFRTPISRWEYEIEETAGGCLVTESNYLQVPSWFIPFAIMITGEPDRVGLNKTNIASTLNNLKRHVEAS